MNEPNQMDFSSIVDGLYLHKGLMAAVFLVIFSLASYLAFSLPNVYESSTQLLVIPPSLPANYVQDPITWSIEDRVRTTVQQILSRTNLEKMIKEFDLYGAGSAASEAMDNAVATIQKNIIIEKPKLDPNRGPRNRDSLSFRLSYRYDDPRKTMQVASRLASLFIEENLHMREQQTMGTGTFIDAEVERLRKELEEQEATVNSFKAQYRYELPEQLEPRLRALDQLRTELNGNLATLVSLQEKKGTLERQLAEAQTAPDGISIGALSERSQPGTRAQQLETLKIKLGVLLKQYSEKHPDVINLKNEVQVTESEGSPQEGKDGKAVPHAGRSVSNPLLQTLQTQLNDTIFQISSAQAKIQNYRSQLASFQAQVDNIPLRAIALAKITRGYDITLKKYQDLLAKSQESKLSENMEKKQKGEQFQILDPANFPQTPVLPNRPVIALGGFFGGLVAAVVLAFLLESLNTSFKRSDEVDNFANTPLLATIPAIITRGSVLARRRPRAALILSSVAATAIGLVLIRIIVSSGANFLPLSGSKASPPPVNRTQ